MSKVKRTICPGCKHSVSNTANFCENCGFNLKSANDKIQPRSFSGYWFVMGFIFIVGLVVVFYYNIKLLDKGRVQKKSGQSQTQSGANQAQPGSNVRMPVIDQNVLSAKMGLVEREPGNFYALVDLGNYLFDKIQFEDALMYYKKALEINPADADVWVDAGVSLFNLSRLDEAADYFKQALQRNPTHNKAMYNLGIVYLNQNKTDDVVKIWSELNKIAPASPEARQAMQYLDEMLKKK